MVVPLAAATATYLKIQLSSLTAWILSEGLAVYGNELHVLNDIQLFNARSLKKQE